MALNMDIVLPEETEAKKDGPKGTDRMDSGNSFAETVGSPLFDSTRYLGRVALKSFLSGVNKGVEAGAENIVGGMPMAGLRFVLGDAVDEFAPSWMSPVKRMKERAAAERDAKGSVAPKGKLEPLTSIGKVAEELPQDEAPGIISKHVGAGVKAASDPTNYIGPSGVAKVGASLMGKVAADLTPKAVVNFFAGTGGEGGGTVGRQLGQAIGGEGSKSELVGEMAGNLLGSVVGGQVNDVKFRAIGKVGEKVGTFTKNAATAASESFDAAKRAGDVKTFFTTFGDRFGDLNKNAAGLLREHTNQKLHRILSTDIEAKEAAARFDQAAKDLGYDASLSDIGQRTGNRTFVADAQARKEDPRTEEWAKILRDGEVKRNSALAKVFDKLKAKVTTGSGKVLEGTIEDSYKEADAVHRMKMEAYDLWRQSETAKLTSWTPEEFAQKGSLLRDEAKKIITDKVTPFANELFETPLKMADEAGFKASPTAMRKIVGEKLVSVEGQLKQYPTLEPLKNLLLGNNEFSMRDIQSQMKVLGQEISKNAQFAKTDMAASDRMRNLIDVRDTIDNSLRGQLASKGHIDIAQKFDEAKAEYAKQVVPLKKTGVNQDIRLQGMGNRPQVLDENVIPAYLNSGKDGTTAPTAMKEFNNLFGGGKAGTERNEGAYKILGEAIESDFTKRVLSGGITQAKVDKFLNDRQPALDAVPGVREKLDEISKQMFDIAVQEKAVKDNWKVISTHPIMKNLGYEGSGELVAKALADPRKMNELLGAMQKDLGAKGKESLVNFVMNYANPKTDGAYDPQKLITLMNMGKVGDGRPGGLEVLFKSALGEKEGAKQIENLKKLAYIHEQNALTNPRYTRPQEGTTHNPVTESTGQSGSSWVTSGYALGSGRIGPVNFASVGLGRFANMHFSEALNNAYNRALFDPKDSDAIIQLMSTKAGTPLKQEVWERVFGTGKEGAGMIKDLFDKGMVLPATFGGARIGAQGTTETLEENTRPPREEVKAQKAADKEELASLRGKLERGETKSVAEVMEIRQKIKELKGGL